MGPLAHLSHSLTLERWCRWNVAFQPHGGSGHLGVLLSLSFTERPRGAATGAPQHRERSTECTLLHALPSAEARTETAQTHSAFSRCRQRRRDVRDALLRMQVQRLKLSAIWQASSALLCVPCAAESMCEWCWVMVTQYLAAGVIRQDVTRSHCLPTLWPGGSLPVRG